MNWQAFARIDRAVTGYANKVAGWFSATAGRRIGTSIAVVFILAYIVLFAGQITSRADLVFTIIGFLVIFGIGYAGRLWYKGKLPVQVATAVLLVQTALIEVLCFTTIGSVYGLFSLLVVARRAYDYFSDRTAMALTVALWLLFAIQTRLATADTQTYAGNLFLWSAALILFTGSTRAQIQERLSRERAIRLLAELEESHAQLRAYAEQVEELSATQERNRIAREIHDSLGHNLTALNVQLEKAIILHDKRPDESFQTLLDAKRQASEALTEVRRSVAAFRSVQPAFSLTAALHTLAETTRSHSSYRLDLEITGSETGFGQQSLLMLYRVVQEALTNIQKYAEARHVDISLRFADDSARLVVHDDGKGFDPALLTALQPGRIGGYGLQGMRERVEAVGGTLDIESAPGAGTRLRVRVPRDQTMPTPHTYTAVERMR